MPPSWHCTLVILLAPPSVLFCYGATVSKRGDFLAYKWPTQLDCVVFGVDHEKRRRHCEVGSPYYEDFYGILDDQGNIVLKSKGKVNLYEQIQSYKDACDINVIINRYMRGDEDALNQVYGMYADVTQMPNNIHDAYERINEAKMIFDSAPIEVRQEYDHNFSKFLKAASTDDFIAKWSNFGKETDVKESEVTAGES